VTSTFWVLEFDVDGCDGEVFLNGAPLSLRGESYGKHFAAPVNSWIVDGENVLEVVVSPGAIPSESRTGPYGPKPLVAVGLAKVTARIAKYPRGAVVGGPDAKVVMQLDWPLRGADGSPTPAFVETPLVLEAREDVGTAFGKWSWQSAEKVTLDNATRYDLVAFLEDVGQALDRGDPGPFLAKSQARLADLERAFGTPRATKEQEIRRGVILDARREGWGLQPLDPFAVDLRACADGRLVQCVLHDFRAALRETPDAEGNVGYYDMFVAKLDGEWAIVR
jgi:hypothetical protein